MLDVYGDLSYAGVRTLERQLLSPQGAENPVVILRLRGRTSVGATLVDMLSNYANRLEQVNGRLYLTGISSTAHAQLADSGKLNLTGPVRIYDASSILGQSTRDAYAEAQSWLYSIGEPEKRSSEGEDIT